MEKKVIKTCITEYGPKDKPEKQDTLLIKKAIEAAGNAYAPYSHFRVGAAVLLKNGKILTGSNQENSAYPSGLCAERVALYYANAQFPTVAVKAIAICALTKKGLSELPVSPCGSCRQAMIETETRFGENIRIILAGKKIIQVIESAESLLPLCFTKNSLGK